ncbi:MAG: DUF3293 domain-containing protein, partial [Gammaproteobacteria bacterium]|nr:DUF3293 domain-containing protein [Gammaproteobacteria bacterium]
GRGFAPRKESAPFHGARKGENTRGEWPGEESILAFGPTRAQATRWCRQFRQHAVVWVQSDGIPLLLLQDGTLLEGEG